MRRLRERANVSRAAAARVIEVSPQSIGRIESGQGTRILALQINALCDQYNADDDERRTLLELLSEFRSAQKTGGAWWRGYTDQLSAGFDHYLSLEDAASKATLWRTMIVPGLLQTPEYRRAIAWAETPEADTDTIERQVDVATRRQSRIRDDESFSVVLLLSEAALHEQVGGPAVMAGQLEHLAAMSDRPNVTVRIVPFDAPSHSGALTGGFTLLEFPPLPEGKQPEPPVVYVEGFSGDLYVEDEPEIRRYQRVLERLTHVALDQHKSRDRLVEVAKEYKR
ncbi:helix-turn-helix domain-containing protein [Nocardia cyriacigeorgica]|nr:helix-turn-helix domain-containing protein [Nocardia cyriacigeorgica]